MDLGHLLLRSAEVGEGEGKGRPAWRGVAPELMVVASETGILVSRAGDGCDAGRARADTCQREGAALLFSPPSAPLTSRSACGRHHSRCGQAVSPPRAPRLAGAMPGARQCAMVGAPAQPKQAVLCHTGPHRATQGHTGPHRATQGHTGPHRATIRTPECPRRARAPRRGSLPAGGCRAVVFTSVSATDVQVGLRSSP